MEDRSSSSKRNNDNYNTSSSSTKSCDDHDDDIVPQVNSSDVTTTTTTSLDAVNTNVNVNMNVVDDGAIVVVAKCPIQGKSKTRLIPLLGEDGSVNLARSMLSDVLLTLEHCPQLRSVRKVLLYAPGNSMGLSIMKHLLDGISLAYETPAPLSSSITTAALVTTASTLEENDPSRPQPWLLLPMIEGDLKSSDLGSKLEDALIRVRRQLTRNINTNNIDSGNDHDRDRRHSNGGGGGGGGIVFLGMDSPILSLHDIVEGLLDSSSSPTTASAVSSSSSSSPCATICPADDGGYGMLCVPSTADHTMTFRDVYWSHNLTAISQIKALTDQNIMVKIGQCMNDIDEPDDVHALCQRLLTTTSANNTPQTSKSTTTSRLDPTKNLHRSKAVVVAVKGSNSSSRNNNNDPNYQEINVFSHHPTCQYTTLALRDAGLMPPPTKKQTNKC